MFTLTNANQNYTLAALIAAAGLTATGLASLTYFTPGGDYATPNTDSVTVGDPSMTTIEDGLIMPPGVRWDEPAAGMGVMFDPTQIVFHSATAGQRILVIGLVR
jgi:hypothetical protein